MRSSPLLLAPFAFAAAALGVRLGAMPQDSTRAPIVRFQEMAARAGVDFEHHRSPTPDKHYVESVPGGLAVFDYNGDGRADIFFTNGARTPSLEKTGPEFANRLYRNDGGMRFTDVTAEAGVAGLGYAMGAAAADFDNDNDVDLFVAGVRRNQLLRNDGNGRFTDVSETAGIASGEWAVAGAWFDYDRDGLLDLFVVNYVQWAPDTSRYCGDQARGIRTYCHPRYFEGLPNRLYRNRGDGTFEDVSARAGIARHVGKGMSIAVADYDHDGRLDVFVTNDAVPNFLFHNVGDGTFRETALLAGVSVPLSGRPVSAMGADFQDYDNDGWEDIHFTALSGETFPLLHNDGKGGFADATHASGLAKLTARISGWCTLFVDVDNDGLKDLFTANSHVNDRIGELETIDWKQPNSLFLNEGKGRFRDVTIASGFGAQPAVNRGCGVADFDEDGRQDLVVLVAGGRAQLWHNETTPTNAWIAARLIGTRSNRDGIGARLSVGNQTRTFTTSSGYASSSHAGVHFGLGGATGPVRLDVQWPSGAKQTVTVAKPNLVIEIRETGEDK